PLPLIWPLASASSAMVWVPGAGSGAQADRQMTRNNNEVRRITADLLDGEGGRSAITSGATRAGLFTRPMVNRASRRSDAIFAHSAAIRPRRGLRVSATAVSLPRLFTAPAP